MLQIFHMQDYLKNKFVNSTIKSNVLWRLKYLEYSVHELHSRQDQGSKQGCSRQHYMVKTDATLRASTLQTVYMYALLIASSVKGYLQ